MKTRTTRYFILFSLILTLLVAGCSNSANSDSSSNGKGESGTLRVGVFSDFVTLNPAKSSSLIDEELYSHIYDPLIVMTEEGELEPNLVTEWTISEDGKTYDFVLREGVKFHDGTDFNAQAIIDNWNWILDPNNASPRRTDLEMIEEFVSEDPYHLTVKFNAPFSPFLATLSGRTGMISSPTAMEKYGDEYDLHPTGTGPFLFESWNKNDRLVIVKNNDYWNEGVPKLDKVEFRPITDPTQKLNALISGQLDLVDSIPFQEIPNVEKADGIELGTATSFGFTSLWLNNTTAPFIDVHNRKALNYAINRDEINQLIYFGNASPAYSHFSPASWANDTNVNVEYSLDKAKEELKMSGNPDGFTFTMISGNDPQSMQLSQLIQSQLAKAGITVELEPLDSAAATQKTLDGDFQARSGGWSGMVDPDQNSYAFDVTGAYFNWGNYESAEVEELLQKARELTNQDERKKLYSEASSAMLEDAGFVFIVHQPVVNAWSEKVKGYKIYPDQLLRLNNVSIE